MQTNFFAVATIGLATFGCGSSDWSGRYVGSFSGSSSSALTLQLTCASDRLSGSASDAFGESTIIGNCDDRSVAFDKIYKGGENGAFVNRYEGVRNGDTISGAWSNVSGRGTFLVRLDTATPKPPTPPRCSTDRDCCAASSSSLCVSGSCQENAQCAADPRCNGSRFGLCSARTTTCSTRPAGVRAPGAPTFSSTPAGPVVVAEMGKLNEFWESDIGAVVHGPDLPSARGNAISVPDGYIYFDPSFLMALDSSAYSFAPSQMVLAHEFGHQIQFQYRTYAGGPAGSTIFDELGADCYAGYFIGWLMCTRALSASDLQATFTSICSIATATPPTPWWAANAHGTCSERTTMFRRGIDAYVGGFAPLTACTLR